MSDVDDVIARAMDALDGVTAGPFLELVGQLQAVAGLLEATQEQLTQVIEDFCALRDALPRETVASLLRGDAR